MRRKEKEKQNMINRTMVRTRVVQTLFAYYQNEGQTPSVARKALEKSFSDTYSLYIALMDLVSQINLYAEQQLEEAASRAKATHTVYVPNRRFVDNRFAAQLYNNRMLRHFVEEYAIRWDNGQDAIRSVYKAITDSRLYKDYMQQPEVTYEDDRRVWRKIFSDIIPANDDMISALEEMEVVLDHNHWATDFEVVASYVVKTIKRFHEEQAGDTPYLADQPLLPMFEKEEELQFGQNLLQYTIDNQPGYEQLINKHLHNWEADRVAYMDRIIMLTALAEILNFPEIALEISLNEYLEIAKEYSGEKSHIFINGILDQVLKEEKDNNLLLKQIRL